MRIRARAPGRVNLIGDHTDYNDGFVLPMAIDFSTTVDAIARSDRLVTVVSEGYRTPDAPLDLDALMRAPSHRWSDYVRGVLIELQRDARLIGADVHVASTIPSGAGLSSSAALEVAIAFAMLGLAGLPIDRVAVAKLAQRAENEYVGARVGIMDQFVCANARKGHALFLDTRSLAFEHVPIPATVQVVICNTMVRHRVAQSDGGYNQRRAQCEEGVAILSRRYPKVRALRDASPEMLESVRKEMSDVVYRRCRHVIAEDGRVARAAAALASGDLVAFGALMNASHASLRDDYEVSCPELDEMVAIAVQRPGVYGARMTGAGFGGCTVNLVDAGRVDEFVSVVRDEFSRSTGVVPEMYVSQAADGAQLEE
jgi:galactokinase